MGECEFSLVYLMGPDLLDRMILLHYQERPRLIHFSSTVLCPEAPTPQ